MKLTLLNTGWLSSAAGIWRRDAPMDQTLRFPLPAYLVETPTERVLIDTGLAADPSSYGLDAFRFEPEPLAAQLDLTTVTKVVLTHLHFDHAGGLSSLPAGVPIYLQRREWAAAQDADAAARNFFQPRDYATLQDPELVDGDADLLGDGSIRLLLLPGHTPGNQLVLVADQVLICGDVIHFASTLEDERLPLFADDHAAQSASVARVRELRDAGVRVLPGHDPEVLQPAVIELS